MRSLSLAHWSGADASVGRPAATTMRRRNGWFLLPQFA
jgi:hypothetical protein